MMYSLADIYEVLGQRSEALTWIERALEGGYPLDVIEDYAAFDDLCKDPRFEHLAKAYAGRPSEDTTGDSKEGEH